MDESTVDESVGVVEEERACLAATILRRKRDGGMWMLEQPGSDELWVKVVGLAEKPCETGAPVSEVWAAAARHLWRTAL